ncbi:MAG: cellulose binding domain-containing protein [Micromonosporaceae bacterium]|nr:cellulose binding domain-containing protein [Micromonosporaceae bacterium]
MRLPPYWTGRHRRRGAWREVALGSVGVLAASGAIWVATQPASASTLKATVTITASQTLGAFSETQVGANLAVWDSLLADSQTATLMADAGITCLRYPGGSYADIYHWEDGTADDDGYVAPNTGFDAFMGVAQAAGAQPIITVNYGSGTAEEAASWVEYANVTKDYGIRYWEVGNEVYGNGHYGSGWENDTHDDQSPKAYATNFLEYASRMKAADPTIKVGVVLTTPGSWPDGVIAAGDTADWNDTVLSIVGDQADFAIVHFYPGGSDEADMLTKPQTLASTTTAFRADLSRWGVGTMPIFVTEVNGGAPRSTQAQALWAADLYLVAAESGIANVDWWNVHNGAGSASTDVTGATDHGDEGIISNGSGSEPAAQVPFRSYYGIQMLSRLVSEGETLVAAASNRPKVAAHAVKRTGGGLDVLLINKDPSNSYEVTLAYSGYSPPREATVDRFPLGATAITTDASSSSARTQLITPYSLVAVHLRTTSGPSGPASASAGPASIEGTGDPGSAQPSSPAEMPAEEPTPGARPCTVYYSTNSWATGFTASVTMSNRGRAALDGWTLEWTFPGDQTVTSTWNTAIAQNGQQVTARNMAYNSTVAVDGSVSFGFQASSTGMNSAPTEFTLNGSACTAM